MDWTPPSDAVLTPGTAWTPPSDAVLATKPVQREKVGTGTALGRGALQGVTLGFGDELRGLASSLMEGVSPSTPGQGRWDAMKEGYTSGRDSAREENAQAAADSPVAYGGAQIAGGIAPALLTGGAGTLGTAAAKGAAYGATAGLGSGEGDAVDQLKSTAIGGAAGAVLGGAGKMLTGSKAVAGNDAARAALEAKRFALSNKAVETAGRTGGNALTGTPGGKDLVWGAGGAIVGPMVGMSPLEGAAYGVATGRGKGLVGNVISRVKSPRLVFPTIDGAVQPAAGGTAAAVVRKIPQSAAATTLALQQMSGRDARKINEDVRAQIDEQAAQGRPVYAATFQALNASPAYRVASEKVAAEDEDDQDDSDDE